MDTQESISRAEDLFDLLESIAWKETVLPEFIKLRSLYLDLLVKAALGQQVQLKAENGIVSPISAAELAGRIAGLDFTQRLFEHILSRGAEAVKSLRDV